MAKHGEKVRNRIGLAALGALAVWGTIFGIFKLRVGAVERETPKEREVIRVILPGFDSAGFVEEGGEELSGFYADYLAEIAKHTGWTYELSVVSDEEELLRLTESGDFDLMLGIPYTQEAAEKHFRFSETALGARRYVLATTREHPGLEHADLSSLMGLNVAVTDSDRNRALEERFKNFCFSNDLDFREDEKNGFPQGVNLVHVGNADRLELLRQNEIDAMITVDSVALTNDLYVILTFGKAPLFAVQPKSGNPELMEELQQALRLVKGLDSGYEERLYNEYFSSNAVNNLTFTEEERAYLEQDRTYRIAVWDGCAPYGYVDDSGSFSGVCAEVFGDITEETDGRLKFEFVVCQDSEDAKARVKSGDCDIQGVTFNSLGTAKKLGGTNSRIYYSDSFYMYRNQYSIAPIEDAVIAVKKDFPASILQEFGVTGPDSVLCVEDAQEGLYLVNEGRADITFTLQNVADYYINYYQMHKLNELKITSEQITLSSIYGETVDPLAAEIMDKCIEHLDSAELDRDITEYILRDHREISLTDYIKAHSGIVLVIMILVLVSVVAFLTAVVITISQKSKRINRMINCDDVTEGSSYRKFLQDALDLLKEKKFRLCVLYLDISNFKYINDSYGYDVGNRVLCAVSEFLEELTGEGHPEIRLPYARVYADHFAALLEYTDRETVQARLERGLDRLDIRCRELFTEFNVFVKIGVYVLKDGDGEHLQKAVNLANYAVDELNNLSRSEVTFYTEEMHDEVVRQQEIEKDMHRAMDEGEFEAYYQSKVDVTTGKVIGAEALVRWKHKEKGLISPGEFVPVFEKNRFIIEVDFCVFEQVCSLQAERLAEGVIPFPVSCNFSRLHLSQPGFVDRLMEVVDRYHVPPEYLELEITETVATGDFDFFVGIVQILKEKGFLISIDDFGSGYSSIQLLYKLPIDVLKFDRVMVVDREQNENKIERELTRSIVNICRKHQIKVICEGVETIEQQHFVESCYDCRYIQGYLYSRPVCLEEFKKILVNCEGKGRG